MGLCTAMRMHTMAMHRFISMPVRMGVVSRHVVR
jgi:hypothetical protein